MNPKASEEDTASSVASATPPESTTEKDPETGSGSGDKCEATEDGKPSNTDGETKDNKEGGDGEKDKEDKILIGAVSEGKDLYAKYDEHGNRSWSESVPDGLEEAAENEQTLKYAVLVRKKKPKEADSTRPLVIDSIVVQSPFLKKVLSEVLRGYPGIVTNVSRLVFHASFECFVHRWEQFAAELENPSHDAMTKDHLTLLHEILKEELGDIITLRQDYFNNKAVTFQHVWTLFPPGCTVLGSQHGRPVAVRFQRGSYENTQCGMVYRMECEGIDWDGSIMGWVNRNQQIPDYVGARPFSDLPCYPIEYHEHPEAIKTLLIERGRRYESLAGYHYKAYDGVALYHPESNPQRTRPENISTRIVVDGANWEKYNSDHTIYPRRLGDDGEKSARSRSGSICSDGGSSYCGSNNDADDLDEDAGRAPMTEQQLMMTTPILRGYALRNRRWMEFFVDEIHEVKFNETAFDSLVLEADHKELILAFAQSQVKFKDEFDDIISGKGKGIIMLLSGGPGIGKTLTAESVAEEMRVPLYVMSAGDLGSEAYEVENNLSKTLAMVSNWNAVLLLDECDIFLEARSSQDMHRNRIVGIFLRMLEYYEGILFLTTNRVNDMDPAFQSRIHISLEYPPLDATSRGAVWKTFLDRTVSLDKQARGSDAYDVTSEEILSLSELNLNGRQIKNVLKMANLLSCQKGEELNFEHLRKVLRVQGHSL